MNETERFLISRLPGYGPELLCCNRERYWIEWEGMSVPLSVEEGCDLMESNGWFFVEDRDPDEEGNIRPTIGPESLV